MAVLAINGGKKVRSELFPAYRVIGKEEEAAAVRVIRSGILSRYLGCWDDDFYGGPEVREMEREWADFYGVKHAISVNSATSALYCAVGAIGTAPGDEIIVSPYTMCASATAPLIYNAVPIFADIEYEYYCLDPEDIERKITDRTRAIIVVDILGQPYDVDRINDIARKHGLYIIEDNAQGPMATYKDRYAGTLGDIGIFSLNYHKHIHCGEGGILVTDSDELAERLRLIRNHAEAVVDAKGTTDLVNMIGFNLRMTELEAAITREQLKKVKALVEERRRNVRYIEEGINDISFLKMPLVREGCEHSYYLHAMKYSEDMTGVAREKFVEAVRAELMPFELREQEGPKVSLGYQLPLYRQSIFSRKIAYGKKSYPFREQDDYKHPECPVCDRVCDSETIIHEMMRPFLSDKDRDDVIEAFHKVANNLDELRR